MAEIERKFRLPTLPPRELLGSGVPIAQGYIFADDGELRIRRKGQQCYLTVKGEGSVRREEWEVEVQGWVFEVLWPKTASKRIEKTRYSIPCGELTIEVDEYQGALKGLITMECEFADDESALKWLPPPWAASAAEVTQDASYKNKVLATAGLPRSG